MCSLRLILNISYDGTAYHGFQKQSSKLSTVQGTLEDVLIKFFPSFKKKLVSKLPITVASGRTDKGVHASEQIVAVLIDSTAKKVIDKMGINKLPTLLDRALPKDIQVHNASLARSDFNPRYGGTVRCYRYQILQYEEHLKKRSEQDGTHYIVREHLDLDRLGSYFKYLEGTHDFTSFSSWTKEIARGKTNLQNPVRTVYKIDLIPMGRELWIDIYANSFLKSMVRSLIGNILFYYQQQKPPAVIAEILSKADNQFAKKRAPAHALFLRRVYFSPLFISIFDK